MLLTLCHRPTCSSRFDFGLRNDAFRSSADIEQIVEGVFTHDIDEVAHQRFRWISSSLRSSKRSSQVLAIVAPRFGAAVLASGRRDMLFGSLGIAGRGLRQGGCSK